MRRLLIGSLVASTLVAVPLASAGRLPTTSTRHETAARSATRYPSSMVVLGHSGATGFASNPEHPFRDAPENSWATGTNPAVNSVYERILALNPAIKGHNANLAQDGATLKEFASQVHRAIALKPEPGLVLVQIGDNDIKCDGQDATRYAAFRAQFAASLTQLTNGLPQARIFVIGEWGTFSSYIKTMLSVSVPARLTHAGKGPCSIFAPQSAPSPGSVVPAHVAYLERTVKGYEAQLAAACAQHPRCRFDGGAAARLVVTAADLAHRFDHLSIAGNAKLAALEWAAMRRLHVIRG
jgi:hypothetical protein